MKQDTAAAVRTAQDRRPRLAAMPRPAATPRHRRERALDLLVLGSVLLHLLLTGLLLSPTWDRGERTPPEPLPLRGIDVVFESASSSAPSLPGAQSETAAPTPGPPSPEALPETPSEPPPATPEVAGLIPSDPPPAPAPASAQLASPSTGGRLRFQADASQTLPVEAAPLPAVRLTPPDEPSFATLAAPVPVRPAPVSRSPAPSRTEAPRRTRPDPASAFDAAMPRPVGPPRQGPAERATGTARLGGEGRGSFVEARSNEVGADWLNALSAWLQEHGSYPRQAAANGDEGTVAVRFVVDRSGRVMTVQLRQTTGSPWLNMAPPAWLHGAQLPPLPPTTPTPQATVDLTIHFVLIR